MSLPSLDIHILVAYKYFFIWQKMFVEWWPVYFREMIYQSPWRRISPNVLLDPEPVGVAV